ncbi:MAG: FecR domain-containing protein [Blastocatellia bacterium]|nr:FecR domain-containing protein [Blastocatellia bacterium]
MNTRLLRVFTLAAMSLMLAMGAVAQSRTLASAAGDKWVISAKAGGVNLVEGQVGVVTSTGRSGMLIKGDELQVGDTVTTEADGRAEILLNPGSYLRMGGNASFKFETTSLDDLQLRIDRGSAILEVFASKDFTVTVITPASRFLLIETGIYRVDVEANGTAALSVRKGRAEVDGENDAVIKKGREATAVADGNVAVSRFNRSDTDSLDEWSKTRARDLARMNSTLRPNDVRDPLMNSFYGNNWNMFNSFGLWVFNPSRGSYAFLPFGSGWSSPYGYWFGYDIWQYRLPRVIMLPPNQTQTPGSGGSTTAKTSSRSVPQARGAEAPPYEKMQGRGSRSNIDIDQTVDMGPARMPTSPAAPPVYVPMQRGSGKKPGN